MMEHKYNGYLIHKSDRARAYFIMLNNSKIYKDTLKEMKSYIDSLKGDE